MTQDELSKRIDEIAWDIGRAYGKDAPFPIQGAIRHLLEAYTKAIVPEKKKYTVLPDPIRGVSQDFINGFAKGETMGQTDVITNIEKKAKDLLG